MKSLKVHFYLKSEADKDKPALIYVSFTVDKRYKISVRRYVFPKWWNKERDRAIILDSGEQTQKVKREYKQINKFLGELEEKIKSDYELNWRRPEYLAHEYHVNFGKSPIERDVKLLIERKDIEEQKEEEFQKQTPSKFFQKYIDNLSTHVVQRTGKVMKSSSATNHRIVLKRYKEFISYMRWPDTFETIENSKYFGKKMEGWLLGVKNYTPNTVCATFSVLKVWLNQAKEEKLFQDEGFHKWKSKGYEVKKEYLTEEELDLIYKLPFDEAFREQYKIDSKSSIEQTRDLFIIGAWTGLRISDLENLNTATWNIEERKLRIYNNKTDSDVVIPLADEVIEIYNKYEGKFPKPVYKSAFNRQIQRCAEIAGIDELVYVKDERGGATKRNAVKKCSLICSHTMRRSFATNFYKKCGNAMMVMMITGHKTEQNFRRYLQQTQEQNADMAMKYFVKQDNEDSNDN